MTGLYPDVLDEARRRLFERLKAFNKDGGVLAGGTAISLQIKHRKSLDFDIFFPRKIDERLVDKLRRVLGEPYFRRMRTSDQITVSSVGGLSVTLVKHEFPPMHPVVETPGIRLFDLRDLGSNKAYTIGRRGVWRDYVDLFFLIKDGHCNFEQMMTEAEKRFDGDFSTKLFLEQLVYVEDVKEVETGFLREEYTREEIVGFFENKVAEYFKGKLP